MFFIKVRLPLLVLFPWYFLVTRRLNAKLTQAVTYGENGNTKEHCKALLRASAIIVKIEQTLAHWPWQEPTLRKWYGRRFDRENLAK